MESGLKPAAVSCCWAVKFGELITVFVGRVGGEGGGGGVMLLGLKPAVVANCWAAKVGKLDAVFVGVGVGVGGGGRAS